MQYHALLGLGKLDPSLLRRTDHLALTRHMKSLKVRVQPVHQDGEELVRVLLVNAAKDFLVLTHNILQ